VRPLRNVARRPFQNPADSEARFERLYLDSFDRVASYLLARADAGLAADAVSRTFEVAWRRLADVPADPIPWLIGVARNVLSELRRASGRRDSLIDRISDNSTHVTGRDPAEVVVDRVVALAALAQLSESDQEALMLVAWDGLSEHEAAESMDCSIGAFAVRLSRARTRLRAVLEEQQSDLEMSEETP
jgi:RNA polymerase sigma-70 factor, ECF subfamily